MSLTNKILTTIAGAAIAGACASGCTLRPEYMTPQQRETLYKREADNQRGVQYAKRDLDYVNHTAEAYNNLLILPDSEQNKNRKLQLAKDLRETLVHCEGQLYLHISTETPGAGYALLVPQPLEGLSPIETLIDYLEVLTREQTNEEKNDTENKKEYDRKVLKALDVVRLLQYAQHEYKHLPRGTTIPAVIAKDDGFVPLMSYTDQLTGLYSLLVQHDGKLPKVDPDGKPTPEMFTLETYALLSGSDESYGYRFDRGEKVRACLVLTVTPEDGYRNNGRSDWVHGSEPVAPPVPAPELAPAPEAAPAPVEPTPPASGTGSTDPKPKWF